MTQREVIYNVKVNTGNSVNDVEDANKAIEELDSSVNDLGNQIVSAGANVDEMSKRFGENSKQADQARKKYAELQLEQSRMAKSSDTLESRLKNLNARVDSGDMSIREMGKSIKMYQELAIKAGVNSPVGQEALNKAAQMKDMLGDLNSRVNKLSSDSAKLDAAMNLGQGVVGGYQAAQGAIALVGVENEQLMKTLVKLQAAQSVMNGLKAIENTLNKDSATMIMLQTKGLSLLTGAKALYTTVVGGAVGITKAFRLALLATGIGAIVVGIGLLIANFEKLTSWLRSATYWFTKLGGMWTQSERDAANATAEASEKIRQGKLKILRAHREKVAGEIAANKELQKSITNTYDWEIEKAKAAGKNTTELEKKKRDELLETYKLQIDLAERSMKLNSTNVNQMIRDMKAISEARSMLVKLDREQQIEDIKANANQSKIAQEEANKREQILIEGNKKRSQMHADLIQMVETMENQYTDQFLTEQQRQINAVEDKYFALIEEAKQNNIDTALLEQAKQSAIDKIVEDSEKARLEKIQALRTEYFLTDLERQEQESQMKRDADLMALESLLLEEEEKRLLIEAIEQAHLDRVAEMNKEAQDKITSMNKEAQDKITSDLAAENEKRKKQTEDNFNNAASFLSDLSNLNTAVTNAQLSMAEGNEEKQEQIRKKSFERNKKIQIAMATISMLQGIIAGLSAPFPMNIAMPILAAATGAANIVAIKNTKYNSSGGASASTPNTSSASASAAIPSFAGADSGTTSLNQDGSVGGSGSGNGSGGATPPPMQVYVLESDITNTQHDVAQVDARSTVN